MAKVAKIPVQGFVIIWVTSIFCDCAYRFRGSKVYLVSCAPSEMADIRDKFPRNQVIFTDDEAEAWSAAKEIALRHRKPRRMSPTTYCQIGANAA